MYIACYCSTAWRVIICVLRRGDVYSIVCCVLLFSARNKINSEDDSFPMSNVKLPNNYSCTRSQNLRLLIWAEATLLPLPRWLRSQPASSTGLLGSQLSLPAESFRQSCSCGFYIVFFRSTSHRYLMDVCAFNAAAFQTSVYNNPR